ncbi:MAG: TonB-dependent receptor plug domain-containing protein [Polyangia bacterium]
MTRFPVVVIALFCGASAFAQPAGDLQPIVPPEEVVGVVEPLPEPANEEVRVTSHTPLTMRDAPGIVSVLDREEIVSSGARDLLDLLQLVPGFSVGVDVSGVVGVSFRGEWAHEGKVLFLLDGHELNETLYSTTSLGMRVPASIIQRIEVIRGPGSAIYGGYAELAVVKITTRAPAELNGIAASTYYGQMENGWGRFMATASGGAELKKVPGLAVKMDVAFLKGLQSDRTYYDDQGASYSLRSGSERQTFLLNTALTYRGLSARFLFEDNVMQTQDGAGLVLPTPVNQRFRSYYADVRYEKNVGHKVTLLPRFSFKHQTPWQTLDKTSSAFYDKSALRLLGGIGVSIDARKDVNILLGFEGYWDHAQLNDPTLSGFQQLFGSSPRVDYGNLAAYAQVFWRNKVANITVGGRYEYNTAYGNSVVPRVGFTRVVGRFNFKLLYSLAFRGPAFENLRISPGLRPERTHTAEAEVGVQLSGHWAFTLDGYFLRITRAIVFGSDATTLVERYSNAGNTGTGGIEAQLKTRYAWMTGTLGYSFYTAANQNDVATYAVPGHSDLLLAAPAHKLTLSIGAMLWRDHVHTGITVVYLSPRYELLAPGPDGEKRAAAEPNTVLLGANLSYRNLGIRGLELTAGVRNALGQLYRVAQPYDGGHAPYPLASREVYLRLSYATR